MIRSGTHDRTKAYVSVSVTTQDIHVYIKSEISLTYIFEL